MKIYKKTLYSGEKYQINAKSNDAITYTVENKYHATVSESSLVTAAFVGQNKKSGWTMGTIQKNLN